MAQKTDSEKEIIWRAAEYERIQRSSLWYFVVGCAALALLIFSFVSGDFFFGVFVVLAFLMLVGLGRIKPQTLNFRLTEEGIGIGPKIFYAYEKLEGFAMNARPGRLDEIVLKKKTAFNPFVKIPIDSKLAVRAQTFLGEKLPPIEYKSSLIDVFADWLGF